MNTRLLIITALESELDKSALPAGVDIVYSGVGKINAAVASIRAIHELQPKKIINFGTVGKINPDLHGLLEIGKVIQRDMMTAPLAPRGQTPFCPKPSQYLSMGGEHICGTGDSFVMESDPWLIAEGVDVVDMELFAIANVAHQSNIPWRSFKYITDDANANSGTEWAHRVNHGQELYLEKLKEIMSA
ncbi:5'-methylthioadenosine nucleosidase [Polynucleobacter sp. AP-Nino-20-G2]|uniref:phosphorylase family protein n=1 Tax=Polynucleobacter sp. AP-Nino-20-G2 TaxID=2576917 RepID=UPI001BFD1268|nr:5'-methylthioadenosine nucleosidase [Polynucleobacter sp. AP-Nino-20-G2]QWE17662.1 5'-methylthioadenosine nucleosidase [Polynucleobacter sp. AP-Nino-20-G2]